MLRVYSKSDIGMVRETNQDDLYCEAISNDTAWVVVCDGMGGANGGDIASSIAVRVIKEYLRNSFNTEEILDSIKNTMEKAINKANKEICMSAAEDSSLVGMGTTVVTALINNGRLYVSHVGDSRAYVTSKERILQVTEDHSVVQEMINKGQITQEQAETHPQKNIITRALGINSEVVVEHTEIELKEDDNILVCTDGLTNHVTIDEIQKAFIESEETEIAERLINMANSLGGRDNITAVVIVR